MKITRLNGIGTSDTMENSERVEAVFVAGGAIGVGEPVILHFANATVANRAKTVIAATTAAATTVAGIYEGIGGSGAVNTTVYDTAGTTLLPGQAAVAGDIITITVYGEARPRVNLPANNGNNIVAGGPLTASKTAARLENQSSLAGADAAGLVSPMVALEASANATGSIIANRSVRCFVRLL